MNKAEQFIKDCTKNCSNEIVAKEPCFHEWVAPEQALKAIEIAREEWLSKACEWLKEQKEMVGVSFQEDFLERFQNYMKGE